VNRLLAHLELCSDLGRLPTGFNQIHYASPKLRRVAPPCHDDGSEVQFSPSVKVRASLKKFADCYNRVLDKKQPVIASTIV
jgi:hypothetical protein